MKVKQHMWELKKSYPIQEKRKTRNAPYAMKRKTQQNL